MALYHYTANTEHQLVQKLTEKLDEQTSVFTPQWIVSGHVSTNNYLIDKIAHHNGIAANIKFKQAIPLIEMIHTTLGLAPERKELIRPEQLTWFIDEIMGSDGFLQLPEAKKIIAYIDGNPQKRFTLAEKVNSLFSSYQEEKPQLIAHWSDNKLIDENSSDEKWQSYIWQELKKRLGDKLRDLSSIFNEVKTALKNEASKQQLKSHFPCLFFYGSLPYSAQLLEVLQALSQEVDVFIFRRTFSTNHDHPMIQNLGKVAERDEKLFENIPTEETEASRDSNSAPENLLEFLQKDLIGKSNPLFNYQPTDDSLVIASAYSVGREVEALYHHLLNLFRENKDLAAREVCVVIPDIETYAPAIKTYFDYTHKNDSYGNPEQLLPYTIYDTSHRIYASPYSAIEALLRIEKDGFTSKNVMKLLDFDFIRERFGFKDTELLIRALDKANIRHGFTGDTALETDLVSWQYGLKRLIYGFCLPPETAGEVANFDKTKFIPVVDFEESDRLELIKLYEFVKTLHEWLEKRHTTRSLSEWITFLEEETLNVFISEEAYDTSSFRRLLGQLDQVVQHRMGTSYSYETMRYAIIGALGAMDAGERIGFGGISFVSPSMFLSVPAKVYAFLGLNGSDFPRKVTEVSFDLSDDDRLNKTEYDKNLFLTLLLAAQEKLYLSYIGNSTKDNSEIPPSSLVSELEAYLLSRLNSEMESLIVRHPLHAFNSRYNKAENPLLVNFDLSNNQDLVETLNTEKTEKDIPPLPERKGKKVIQLRDLINFMEDPVKHYFIKTLGVYMSDHTIELAETESFSLDALQGWMVKDELVKAGLHGIQVDEKTLKMKGHLPLSKVGTKTLKKLEEEVQPIIENEHFLKFIGEEPAGRSIELELENYILQGKVNSIYNETFLFVTSSSSKAKYQIRALMNYYVAFCQGDVKDLLYIAGEGKTNQVNSENQNAEEIKQTLNTWCKKYEQGTEELICFESGVMGDKNNIDDIINLNEVEKPERLHFRVNSWINSGYNHSITSDYFKYMMQNGGLLTKEKANAFIEMYNAIQRFTQPLN